MLKKRPSSSMRRHLIFMSQPGCLTTWSMLRVVTSTITGGFGIGGRITTDHGHLLPEGISPRSYCASERMQSDITVTWNSTDLRMTERTITDDCSDLNTAGAKPGIIKGVGRGVRRIPNAKQTRLAGSYQLSAGAASLSCHSRVATLVPASPDACCEKK